MSRPLALLERVFDGDLWFFTEDPSPKTEQIRANDQVNVAVQAGNDFVSLAGTATVSKDRTMIEGLWNRHAEAWFENGIDDPKVALCTSTPTPPSTGRSTARTSWPRSSTPPPWPPASNPTSATTRS